jgi:hypothetical protein
MQYIHTYQFAYLYSNFIKATYADLSLHPHTFLFSMSVV